MPGFDCPKCGQPTDVSVWWSNRLLTCDSCGRTIRCPHFDIPSDTRKKIVFEHVFALVEIVGYAGCVVAAIYGVGAVVANENVAAQLQAEIIVYGTLGFVAFVPDVIRRANGMTWAQFHKWLRGF